MRERNDRRLGDPIWWNDVVQLAKTALAAVVAWVIAASVLDLPQPFLAPWAALLVVHATVYRTFSKGTQQVAATVVAVLLATGGGGGCGADAPGLSRCCWSSASCSAPCRGWGPRPRPSPPPGWWCSRRASRATSLLISRLLDTGIGVGSGLLVNLLVWPPLRRRTADVAMDRIDDGIGSCSATSPTGCGEGCQTRTSPGGSTAAATSTVTWTMPGPSCGRRRRAPDGTRAARRAR